MCSPEMLHSKCFSYYIYEMFMYNLTFEDKMCINILIDQRSLTLKNFIDFV